jgi:hypothetical protein
MQASVPGWRARYRWCRLALVVLFLIWFLQFYRSGFGFTYVLMFSERRAETRVHRMAGVPIYVHPGGGYDGMFYVQLAVDPLLRDPSIDFALDAAAYRARRILFSWTAWALGLGQPRWVVQAYSVQNVLFWLILALWLYRRFPHDSLKDLVTWSACVFGPGLVDSTRLALVDGPSLLVLALGVAAIERNSYWTGSAILGLSGLARETTALAGVALVPSRWSLAALSRLIARATLVLLPMLVWIDYLRSIYRSSMSEGHDQVSRPIVAYLEQWRSAVYSACHSGWISIDGLWLLALVGVTAQAVFLLLVRRWREPWWRVGIAFVGLMLVMKAETWAEAYLRVLLPLSFSFNLSLARDRWFWPVFVLGNLGLGLSAARIAAPFVSRAL